MRCPFCKDDKGSKVLDSREASQGFVIRRRRECLQCERRFTTYERLEEANLRVVKKDGTRQPFDGKKLRECLLEACGKRPIAADRIEELATAIEGELRDTGEREVPSELIRELVMRELKRLDRTAFFRYASYYQDLFDVPEFHDLLEELRKPVE